MKAYPVDTSKSSDTARQNKAEKSEIFNLDIVGWAQWLIEFEFYDIFAKKVD